MTPKPLTSGFKIKKLVSTELTSDFFTLFTLKKTPFLKKGWIWNKGFLKHDHLKKKFMVVDNR